MDAFILYPDGDVREIEPHNGENFSFDELSELLNGYAIAFPLPDHNFLVVDNEAKRKEKSVNNNANIIFKTYFNNVNDYMAGNVIICTLKSIQ